MAKRKSTAQLKRLQKRANQRGESYDVAEKIGDETEEDATYLDDTTPTTVRKRNDDQQENNEIKEDEQQEELASKRPKMDVNQDSTKVDQKLIEKRKIAIELKNEIKSIEGNEELKAKERRSAKRKAEAIAMEKTGVTTAKELLDWLETYETNKDSSVDDKNKAKPKPSSSLQSRTQTPNILFVGQLTFDTTKEEILECFRKHLKETEKLTVANNVLSVRLLTHAKTGKSKGMAFLEIKDSDPMILYSCLKMHHTYLKGRRINVERTSGGGKATKQAKVATLRKNQVDYMKETVQSILSGYDTSSLDEGCLALCERHNATVVHAGMERFVETDGPNKENPSAYLTALLQKLATEGIFDRTKKEGKKPPASAGRFKGGGNRGGRRS